MEIVKDDSKREKRFHYLARHMVEKAIEKDALIVSENNKGIAILFRTNSREGNFWKDLITDLKLAINVTGIRKGLRVMKNQQYIKAQRPKEGDYLYCWFWGILPDARGSDDAKIAYEKGKAISQGVPVMTEEAKKILFGQTASVVKG